MMLYEPDPEVPKTVTLHAECLLSKWGFCDGDLLEWLCEFGDFNEHDVLCAVVKQKLIPALAQKVEVEVLGTCHNPIRAKTVDGVDVTDLWFDAFRKMPAPVLTPASVDVTVEEILAIARSLK